MNGLKTIAKSREGLGDFMETIIEGNSFFQKGIFYQQNNMFKKMIFNERIGQLFQENNIYTLFTSKDNRFKVNRDFIEISGNATIEPYTLFGAGNRFYTMGSFSYTRSILPLNTIVGRYCSIANNVTRIQRGHPLDRFTTSNITYVKNNIALNQFSEDQNKEFSVARINKADDLPIVIGNDVWIGQDVRFGSKGITVGDGAVIAAGSIVTKDVPPYAVVAGIPARIIKFRFESHIIQKLLNLKWWQYAYTDFNTVQGDIEIDQFIDILEKLVAKGELLPYEPETITIRDFVE